MHQNQSHSVRQPLRSPDMRAQFSNIYTIFYLAFSRKRQ